MLRIKKPDDIGHMTSIMIHAAYVDRLQIVVIYNEYNEYNKHTKYHSFEMVADQSANNPIPDSIRTPSTVLVCIHHNQKKEKRSAMQ